MCLNCMKCKVMHFGKENPEKDLIVNGDERLLLGKTETEKDPGVIIEYNGKSSK